ncbi:hypothetical protein M9458_052475, partial [Cirrhinus mrigala]
PFGSCPQSSGRSYFGDSVPRARIQAGFSGQRESLLARIPGMNFDGEGLKISRSFNR